MHITRNGASMGRKRSGSPGLVICALVAILTSSCGGYWAEVYRTYPGPDLRRQEVALLIEYLLLPVGITSVDNNQVGTDKGAYPRRIDTSNEFKDVLPGFWARSPGANLTVAIYELKPGRHTVVVSATRPGIVGHRSGSEGAEAVSFEALAGHVYWLLFDTKDTTSPGRQLVNPKIEDVTSTMKK
jgi:hypothetical protein